jgi:hypothetical protein
MHKLVSFLQSRPVYLLLLPVFFVFHGWVENFNAIPLADAFWLLLTYFITALVIFFLGWLLYRDQHKAALLAFCLMAFHFFFGILQDLVKNWLGNAFITRYSFVFPFFLILFILLIIILKKKKGISPKTGFFLNVLFSVLILLDAGWLLSKLFSRSQLKQARSFQKIDCGNCAKPDIYLLIFDEYGSSSALKECWSYDNSDLDSFLLQKKFRIFPSSKSNYNFTEFSMASTLNMDWLAIADPGACTIRDYNRSFELIKKNQVANILRSAGYTIRNYSIFDIENEPSFVSEGFLPLKTKLITSQTFISRVKKDLFYHLLTGRFEVNWLTKDLIYNTKHNNEKIIEAMISESRKDPAAPRFIYGHIEMPHPPFYYENGREKSKQELLAENDTITVSSYLGYLPQTNLVVKKIVTSILDNTKKPVVIILLGDHGFRVDQPKDYHFRNLNAVYTSSGDYTGFYENMTNINEFRVLFNNLFRASFPLMKDSTVFLKDN